MPPRERELIKLIDAARAADVDQVSAEFTTCTQEEARERDRPALAADEVAEQAIAACFPKFEWFVRGRAMSVAALATGPSADDLESYADSVVEEQRAKFRNQLVQEVTASRAATGKK